MSVKLIEEKAEESLRSGQKANLTFNQFWIVFLIIGVIAVGCFVGQALMLVPVKGDNMYPEAAGVVTAQRWAHGSPLYQDYRQSPYLVTAFTPLWYLCLGLVSKAGVSSLDSLTLFGRILSLLSVFGSIWLGYRWNRRIGISPRLALFTPILYLSFPILIPWAITARPDFPALFFSLLAVYFAAFVRGEKGASLAAFIAALAFLIRHNSVGAPVAIVLWLLWSKRWKSAVLFCGVWALLVASVLIPFQISSHGALVVNLSGAKYGAMAVTYIRDVIFRVLLTPGYAFSVVLFALGFLAILEYWKNRDSRGRLLSLYVLMSLVFAVVGSAAAGAAVNHFLEAGLGLAILAPFGLSRIKETWSQESSLGWFLTFTLLFLLLPTLDMQRWGVFHNKPDDFRRVEQMLRGVKTFSDIPYLAARGSSPEYLDLVSLSFSERSRGIGAWTSASLVSSLRQKEYNLVVLHQDIDEPYDPTAKYPRYPRLDAAVRNAVRENYGRCFELDGTFVYAPIDSDHLGLDQPACPAHIRPQY